MQNDSQIYSLAKLHGDLIEPIEIDLKLVPGIPQLQIVGLADAATRESAVRIRTALRNCGFVWPKRQTVLVDLKPHSTRKLGVGIDLAIVYLYLQQSGQIPAQDFPQPLCISGEIGLAGEVISPEALRGLQDLGDLKLMTGPAALKIPSLQLKTLEDLKDGGWSAIPAVEISLMRPEPYVQRFKKSFADLLEVIAAGEHSILLAGPSGSGKTTFADNLAHFIDLPDMQMARILPEAVSIYSENVRRIQVQRPTLKPHHNITAAAFMGTAQMPGELERAHGGVMVLDELMEYPRYVQECLREPSDHGSFRVVRGYGVRAKQLRVLMVATTNMCKCGEFYPGAICACSNAQLRNSFARLSKPLVDRFQVMHWAIPDRDQGQEWVDRAVILNRVQKAIEFRKKREQLVPNAQLSEAELAKIRIEPLVESQLLSQHESQRRRKAMILVARTLADLEQSEKVELKHFNRAHSFCVRPFLELKKATS